MDLSYRTIKLSEVHKDKAYFVVAMWACAVKEMRGGDIRTFNINSVPVN